MRSKGSRMGKGGLLVLYTPVFIDRAEDAGKLVWDDFTINNLAIYLLDRQNRNSKVALCQGCDSRGSGLLPG